MIARSPGHDGRPGTSVPGRNNPAPPLASTPAWNALLDIWGRPIRFTCFDDLADDQRQSTSPLTLIFARCLALIHPFLSSGAAGPLGRHWGPSKNFRADGTILASRDPMDVLGLRFFQASRIGTGDGRPRIIDPQGAGTGLINRVKESVSISSQGLTKSGDGCNP